MRIEWIDSLSALDALRDDWLRLHAQDRWSTVFTSWWWLRPWVELSPYPWAMLVVRDESTNAVSGLFPISPRGWQPSWRVDLPHEIHAAGDQAADYRGLIVDATRETDVIRALADYLSDDRAWDRIVLRDIMDHRVRRMIQRLAQTDASIAISERRGQPCPMLELPDSWEQYLQQCLTPPSRKSLKKRLRVAAAHGCRMSTMRHAEPSTQLDTLFQLAIRKGLDAPDHLQRCLRFFQSCILGGCAEIAVLWLDG